MFEHPQDSPFSEVIDNKIQSAENSAQYQKMFHSRKFDSEKMLGVVATTPPKVAEKGVNVRTE